MMYLKHLTHHKTWIKMKLYSAQDSSTLKAKIDKVGKEEYEKRPLKELEKVFT